MKNILLLAAVFHILLSSGCARTVEENAVHHHISLRTIVEGIKQGKFVVDDEGGEVDKGNIYNFEMPQNVKSTMITNGYVGMSRFSPSEDDAPYKYVDRKYGIEKCVKLKNIGNTSETFFMDGHWAYEGVNNNEVICYTEGKRVVVKPGEIAELCIAACPDVLRIKEPVSYFGFASLAD